MTTHPAADAFPMMDQNRFQDLVDDIREHGQHEPITLLDGMILDGRNRYKACLELGINPKTKDFDGDPWAYVWSLNGERRDLVAEQRYLIWKFCHEQSDAWQAEKARIQAEANRKRSEAQVGIPKEEIKERAETESCRTSKHPEAKAKATASKTNPGAVARGDKLAKERPDLAEKVRLSEMKPAEAHRQMKKDEVKEKTKALPEGKYRVIYADPPWKYGDSRGDLPYGPAENHYPPMTIAELCALEIPADENAVMFLWTTSPMLEDAFKVINAWKFKYRTSMVWDKDAHNFGHYVSVRHELLLICVRGSCLPDSKKLLPSVVKIKRKEHSRKPEEFRQMIDQMYSYGTRIELFAREKVANWDSWGNEAKQS